VSFKLEMRARRALRSLEFIIAGTCDGKVNILMEQREVAQSPQRNATEEHRGEALEKFFCQLGTPVAGLCIE
jgi:hypothetical protein